MQILASPWPWYVGGPLIGLMVPLLLLLDNRTFGVSTSFEHVCAALFPGRATLFAYDWKKKGAWNLALVVGILLGGFLSTTVLSSPEPVAISQATRTDLAALGVTDFHGLVPSQIFNWSSLASGRGLLLMIGGGFLIGFGTRYGGGCTSGHAIFGLSDLQLPSLIAVVGFFVGGLVTTHLLLPWIL